MKNFWVKNEVQYAFFYLCEKAELQIKSRFSRISKIFIYKLITLNIMDLNLNCAICKITQNTFEVIKKVYDYQKEKKTGTVLASLNIGSRIIFPMYCSGETRISEQELRFIFVEQFNAYIKDHKDLNNLYYSVETPTGREHGYIFSKGDEPKRGSGTEPGVSARTDLVIHEYDKNTNAFNRKALIEFKALNPVERNYKKDFCKLNEEDCESKYFIQIIKNYNVGTIKSLREKIKSKGNNIIYKCYCIDKGEDITTEITPDEKNAN